MVLFFVAREALLEISAVAGLAEIEADLLALLVRMPQIESKAFFPAVPGFGRSQTMWA